MGDENTPKCDLTVIGAGIAGMAATLFSANRGISVIQVGDASEIGFASGLFDLLGVHPVSKGQRWDNPWAGIETLTRDIPRHPYARLPKTEIAAAFDELLAFLEDVGLPYHREPNRNATVITHLGTLKTTYCVPQTMWGGVTAFDQKQPCVLIDFSGLKGFSASLIAGILGKDWPALRAARIHFPGTEHMDEVLPEHMANALVIFENRQKLAQAIRPHVKDAAVVGLPAVLGLYQSPKTTADLAQLIGIPVFEIPTMPPSIPGLRLKEAFERGLREKRTHYFTHCRVLEVKPRANGGFVSVIGPPNAKRTILSKGVVLASGRFIGGGLSADRKHIRETIFDLPVIQPPNRAAWHREDIFDPRGHPINHAGLEIDEVFRPLNSGGRPAFKTLFAAGSILAHQDWKRMKCGVGLAIATAFGAVRAFMDTLGNA